MHVQPADTDAFSLAVLEGAASAGLKRFPNSGGRMMTADGGCAVADNIIHNGKRQSVYRSYVYPRRQQSNLTVLTAALKRRAFFLRAAAPPASNSSTQGQLCRAWAAMEVVLSQGAIQTPKLMMQSGIGDEGELGQVWHSRSSSTCPAWDGTCTIMSRSAWSGRGRRRLCHRLQEAPLWRFGRQTRLSMRRTSTPTPSGFRISHPKTPPTFPPPGVAWTLFMGMRPASRGSIHLTGANASDPLRIDANYLGES